MLRVERSATRLDWVVAECNNDLSLEVPMATPPLMSRLSRYYQLRDTSLHRDFASRD